MDIIKGFALNRGFIDNTPGVVADIGELSTKGFTFAKEPRVYSSQTYPTISLVHFPTIGSGVGTSVSIPDVQKEHILKVIAKIYEKSASATIVFAPGAFIEYLIAQMGTEIADITVGGVITSGNRSIIEWIQWRNPKAAAGNINKVWFSDKAFVGQADEYEITVIPPFMPPNQFFGQPAEVKYMLTSLSYSQEMEKIQEARGKSAETKLWGNTYDYVNPVNRNDKTPAKFTCLLYGAAADNIDLIKEAIVQYLLKNSTYTRDQWKNILPDLFMRTEFMIFPQWERMAVENVVGSTNGIFSPVIDLTAIANKLVEEAVEYDEAHIREFGQALTFPYMSVAATTIGHTENRDSKKKITDWYPDYFFVNNTNADFNRLSLATQEWVLMIMEMLQIARAMTTSTTIPQGFSRVKRGRRLFLAKSHKSVQYLIAAPGIY